MSGVKNVLILPHRKPLCWCYESQRIPLSPWRDHGVCPSYISQDNDRPSSPRDCPPPPWPHGCTSPRSSLRSCRRSPPLRPGCPRRQFVLSLSGCRPPQTRPAVREQSRRGRDFCVSPAFSPRCRSCGPSPPSATQILRPRPRAPPQRSLPTHHCYRDSQRLMIYLIDGELN